MLVTSHDEMMETVRETITAPCLVRYSMYKTVEYGHDNGDWTVENNLTDVAVEGTVVFIRASWEAGNYRSKPFTNPTWLDVCKAANESILLTGDHHHVFLERLDCEKAGTYTMSFGS